MLSDDDRLTVAKVKLRLLGVHSSWIAYAERRVGYTLLDFELWATNTEKNPASAETFSDPEPAYHDASYTYHGDET